MPRLALHSSVTLELLLVCQITWLPQEFTLNRIWYLLECWYMYLAFAKLQSFLVRQHCCVLCPGRADYGNPGVTSSSSGLLADYMQAEYRLLHSTSWKGHRFCDGTVNAESTGRWRYSNTRAGVCSESKSQSSQFVLPIRVAILIKHRFPAGCNYPFRCMTEMTQQSV